jgi:hypothetical protein
VTGLSASRRATLLALLLPAGLACTPAPAPPADAAPRLVVDPGSFDFGDVRPGSSPSRRFRLRNAGGAPLRILDVSSTCGCLVSRPDTDTIAPGGATELRVTLSVTDEKGPLLRSVTLKTNDPAQPEQSIEVRAHVPPNG